MIPLSVFVVGETRGKDVTSWTLNRLPWIYPLKRPSSPVPTLNGKNRTFHPPRVASFFFFLKVPQQFDFVWGQRKGADSGWRWRRTHGDATLECYFFDADGLSLRTSSSTRPLGRSQAVFLGLLLRHFPPPPTTPSLNPFSSLL